jgi:hypothetical protein
MINQLYEFRELFLKYSLILTSSSSASLRFFVYPDPGGERRTDEAKQGARRSQNQFTPLPTGRQALGTG